MAMVGTLQRLISSITPRTGKSGQSSIWTHGSASGKLPPNLRERLPRIKNSRGVVCDDPANLRRDGNAIPLRPRDRRINFLLRRGIAVPRKPLDSPHRGQQHNPIGIGVHHGRRRRSYLIRWCATMPTKRFNHLSDGQTDPSGYVQHNQIKLAMVETNTSGSPSISPQRRDFARILNMFLRP